MIGTAIITLALILLVYPVLTKEKMTKGKLTWMEKQRITKEYLKQWEPTSEDSEIIVKEDKIMMKGGWRTKPKLRYRLKDKKVKILIFFIFIIVILLLMDLPLVFIGLLGAAFTSKATGDWDAAGQTTWNEVGFPGPGDTVTIQNNHVIKIDSGTGNEACLSIEVENGGSLLINSEGSGALSLTFDDAIGAGIIAATAGTVTWTGTAGNLVTITSAGSPPTNYWAALFNGSGAIITMDYVTIEYHTQFGTSILSGGRTWDIDNCTFQNNNGQNNVWIRFGTVTSFTNNTITGGTYGLTIVISAIVTNVTISGTGTYDFYMGYSANKVEFINSNFDITRVRNLGSWISKDHNDVSGTYHIATNSTLDKSAITNDFTSSDNVTLRGTGTFTIDEAAAHNNLTIMVNSTFDVNGGVTQTITHTGTITVDSGGTLEWTGSAGNLITLVSSSPGTEWSLVNNGTVNVSYVDVTDSDASGGTAIDATDGTSIGKAQNNTNWLWPPAGGGGGPNSSHLILPLELSG